MRDGVPDGRVFRNLGIVKPAKAEGLVFGLTRTGTDEADGASWLMVLTPSGQPGWAALQYLDR